MAFCESIAVNKILIVLNVRIFIYYYYVSIIHIYTADNLLSALICFIQRILDTRLHIIRLIICYLNGEFV